MAQVNLSRTEDKIEEINGNVDELKEKEREATEYKWKDIEPLLKLMHKFFNFLKLAVIFTFSLRYSSKHSLFHSCL